MKLSLVFNLLAAAVLTGRALDINDPTSFNHKSARVNNRNYHYVDQGPEDGKLVVLSHGFPESWYLYKHQIAHLSEKLGYRVIALDMLGYGTTDAPAEVSAYSYANITSDIKELVKSHLNRDKAIFVGHDWGSPITWQMGLSYPDLVEGIISICVPFYKDIPVPALEYILPYLPALSYQVSIDRSDLTKLESHLEKFITFLYSSDPKNLRLMSVAKPEVHIIDHINSLCLQPKPYTDLSKPCKTGFITGDFDLDIDLSQSELDYVIDQIKTHGIKGPTNWYRGFTNNNPFLAESLKKKDQITAPSLFIKASEDMVNDFGDNNAEFVKDVTTEVVNAGHWAHLTQPAKVNEFIENWLNAKFPQA